MGAFVSQTDDALPPPLGARIVRLISHHASNLAKSESQSSTETHYRQTLLVDHAEIVIVWIGTRSEIAVVNMALNDRAGEPAGPTISESCAVFTPLARGSDIVRPALLIPHGVLLRVLSGATPVRAWREHFRLTQQEIATRLGISQPAMSDQERSRSLRHSSVAKIAKALGIEPDQLKF